VSATLTTVSVKILDKEYQVACPPEEVDALTAAARYLDQKMFNIRETGKVFGLDRIAVMAALNIANEFLANRHSADTVQSEVGTRIDALNKQLTNALSEHKQLDL
jgi:cell division protein ZapA